MQPSQRMTATEATQFQGVSMTSIMQVQLARDSRSAEGTHATCTCSPYEDIFTFNRWKALGLSVRKGEKALRISSFAPTGRTREDAETPILRPVCLALFCRCQVEATKPKLSTKGGVN